MLSPDILKCEDPLFLQDEESGEQKPVEKSFVREVVRRNAPLVSFLNDLHIGVVHMTMAEYNAVSHKLMFAWLMFKGAIAEKRKGEQQGNPV